MDRTFDRLARAKRRRGRRDKEKDNRDKEDIGTKVVVRVPVWLGDGHAIKPSLLRNTTILHPASTAKKVERKNVLAASFEGAVGLALENPSGVD